MSDQKTVAGAYARIEAHEDLCAERYRAINETLGDLKAGQQNHSKAAWMLVLALLGWMGVQLWNGVPHATAAQVAVVGK